MSQTLTFQIGLRFQTTAQMAQTMTLIELPVMDLQARVTAELAANPALELVPGLRCSGCGRRTRRSPCLACTTSPAAPGEPIVHEALAPRWTGQATGLAEAECERPEPCERETLAEYVLRQVAPVLDASDRPVAAYLLARLDERGLLPELPQESASFLGVPVERVLAVLRCIGHVDPAGVGASDVRQCLIWQLESLNETGQGNALALYLIQDQWDLLSRRDLGRIARSLRIPASEVESAAAFIARNLTPYPAHAFWGDRWAASSDDSAVYHQPDALFMLSPEGQVEIEIVSGVGGWLRVAPHFQAALAEAAPGAREEMRVCLERAELWVKSLRQRQHTIRRLLQTVVREQRDYILGGQLRPLTRAQIAAQLELHESTVSRAVAGKLVALPTRRIVPLAQFFDPSLSARRAVRAIVETEARPLSDAEIAVLMSELGYAVSRRTVTKYRLAEGILSSAERAR